MGILILVLIQVTTVNSLCMIIVDFFDRLNHYYWVILLEYGAIKSSMQFSILNLTNLFVSRRPRRYMSVPTPLETDMTCLGLLLYHFVADCYRKISTCRPIPIMRRSGYDSPVDIVITSTRLNVTLSNTGVYESLTFSWAIVFLQTPKI